MIGNPCFHRWRDPRCLVNSGEIVIYEVQGHRRLQVIDLLGEAVGQSRKSPHGHSHGQILPLDKRRGNVPPIREAGDSIPSSSKAFRRAVSLLLLWRFPKQLHPVGHNPRRLQMRLLRPPSTPSDHPW